MRHSKSLWKYNNKSNVTSTLHLFSRNVRFFMHIRTSIQVHDPPRILQIHEKLFKKLNIPISDTRTEAWVLELYKLLIENWEFSALSMKLSCQTIHPQITKFTTKMFSSIANICNFILRFSQYWNFNTDPSHLYR